MCTGSAIPAGSVSTDQQEKEIKKTNRAYGRAYHDQETANSDIDSITSNV